MHKINEICQKLSEKNDNLYHFPWHFNFHKRLYVNVQYLENIPCMHSVPVRKDLFCVFEVAYIHN